MSESSTKTNSREEGDLPQAAVAVKPAAESPTKEDDDKLEIQYASGTRLGVITLGVCMGLFVVRQSLSRRADPNNDGFAGCTGQYYRW